MPRWKADEKATLAARDAFPQHAPRVFRHGEGQVLLLPTPFGRVELIAVREGYVVAAERPPEPKYPRESPKISSDTLPHAGQPPLPESIVRHLASNGLHLWKTVPSHELTDVIHSLAAAPRVTDEAAPGGLWCPFLRPLAAEADLVGESRTGRAEQLGSLVAARTTGDPLPDLAGVDGIGKRTLTAWMAQEHGWTVYELPLARVLAERVFQTPIECFLEIAMGAADHLGPNDVLVISDAEIFQRVERLRRPHMLRELALLPRVCLLSRQTSPPQDGVVPLACPGLESYHEVEALVAAEFPDVSFEGAALELLAQSAAYDTVGVIPGRLLYLVRLAVTLLGLASGSPIVLAPDEAANVISLARPAWAEQEEQ